VVHPVGYRIGRSRVGISALVLHSTTLLVAGGVVVTVAAAWWRRSRGRLGVFLLASCLATSLIACTQVTARPPIENLGPCQLGFRGQLTESDPELVPRGIASATAQSSRVLFRYSEEATHEHYTVPIALGLLLSLLDLLGAPLGRYAVSTKARLVVAEGSRQLAEYQGEA
jgi:hypothetical protein